MGMTYKEDEYQTGRIEYQVGWVPERGWVLDKEDGIPERGRCTR